MKKLNVILLLIALTCLCEVHAQKNYVTISGKIKGAKNFITIISRTPITQGEKPFSKKIKVHPDGSFKDTLTIPKSYSDYNKSKLKAFNKSYYYLRLDSPKLYLPIYLANGFNLKIFSDVSKVKNNLASKRNFLDNLNENLKFSGNGAIENKVTLSIDEVAFNKIGDYRTLDKKSFDKVFNTAKKSIDSVFNLYKDKGITKNSVRSIYKENIEAFLNIPYYYKKAHTRYLNKKREEKQLKGKPSPKFVNYKNFKGGTTSLDDFIGKYVYIDVWATWCGWCKKEIPYLKKIEKQYKSKNITFISISVDSKKQYNKWRKMVADKQLKGVQLFADNSFNSKFIMDYKIKGIPRFILIDPNGNIVSPNAPRPSSPKLKDLFKTLGI